MAELVLLRQSCQAIHPLSSKTWRRFSPEFDITSGFYRGWERHYDGLLRRVSKRESFAHTGSRPAEGGFFGG